MAWSNNNAFTLFLGRNSSRHSNLALYVGIPLVSALLWLGCVSLILHYGSREFGICWFWVGPLAYLAPWFFFTTTPKHAIRAVAILALAQALFLVSTAFVSFRLLSAFALVAVPFWTVVGGLLLGVIVARFHEPQMGPDGSKRTWYWRHMVGSVPAAAATVLAANGPFYEFGLSNLAILLVGFGIHFAVTLPFLTHNKSIPFVQWPQVLIPAVVIYVLVAILIEARDSQAYGWTWLGRFFVA